MIASDQVIKDALEAHPELELLLRLDPDGWTWMPPPIDEQGHPLEIHGVRTWVGEGEVDAIRFRSSTDALALRMTPYGGILWGCEGSLTYVLERLISLPSPASPYAPRLVIGTAPSDWRTS